MRILALFLILYPFSALAISKDYRCQLGGRHQTVSFTAVVSPVQVMIIQDKEADLYISGVPISRYKGKMHTYSLDNYSIEFNGNKISLTGEGETGPCSE